ncbi:MAG TPA: DJ-1 family protein [Actinobacteria bacterium]|nr:DJ-1 family protein [Actinomycetota bacterium]
MKKLSVLLIILLIATIIVGCKAADEGVSGQKEPATETEGVEEVVEEPAKKETLTEGKEVPEKMKVLMIIASNNFRDEEYDEPRKILEANGAEVIVASSSSSIAKGMLGMTVKPDILVDDVVVGDYDAIIFVGGSGADEYYTNQKALSIAKEAVNSGKVLGAICIAPVTLANAGVLDGKEATVFSSKAAQLRAKGAIYVNEDVVQAGKIITARGPQAASVFGQTIIDTMKQNLK